MAENKALEKDIKLMHGEDAVSSVVNSSDREGEVLVEDSLALNSQEAGEKRESLDDLVARLDAESKKIIEIGQIQPHVQDEIEKMVMLLAELKAEVFDKKSEAISQSEIIKDKVNALVQSGKVQIDQGEYERSAASVLQYAALLDSITAEVDMELAFFGLFFSDKQPQKMVVWKDEPNDFAGFVGAKSRYIKKYVKNIRKDLNVSFSRYVYGFRAQNERILQVEAYIRYQDRLQEQASKSKA